MYYLNNKTKKSPLEIFSDMNGFFQENIFIFDLKKN
jgi:hypothetical protein